MTLFEAILPLVCSVGVLAAVTKVVCLRMRLNYRRYVVDTAVRQNTPIDPAEVIRAGDGDPSAGVANKVVTTGAARR